MNYDDRDNAYFYVGTRLTLGYRFGHKALMIIPQFEFGLNLYDRTDGKNINPINLDTLSSAETGFVFSNSRFVKKKCHGRAFYKNRLSDQQ